MPDTAWPVLGTASNNSHRQPTVAPLDLHRYMLLLQPCLLAQLQPQHYASQPPQPRASFILQHKSGTGVLPRIVQPLLACAAGHEGQEPLPLELLVNSPSSSDAGMWARVGAASGGRVVPLFAHGLTDVLAFNRLAGLAKGSVLLVIQDTQPLLPSGDCAWLRAALDLFERWPRLGSLELLSSAAGPGTGSVRATEQPAGAAQSAAAVAAAAAAAAEAAVAFQDPWLGLPLQFVGVAGGAGGRGGPWAVRRAAWAQLGGMDVGLPGAQRLQRRVDGQQQQQQSACSVCSKMDLSVRLWLAGWQVAQSELLRPTPGAPRAAQPGLHAATPGANAPGSGSGPIHREAGACTRQQLLVCAALLRAKWGPSATWDQLTAHDSRGGAAATGQGGVTFGAAAAGSGGDPGSAAHGSYQYLDELLDVDEEEESAAARIMEHARSLNLHELRLRSGAVCPYGEGVCAA